MPSLPAGPGRLLPLPAVFAELGIKTTKAYELIACGKLHAVKLGRRTLITESSIQALKASLPRAAIGGKAA